MADLLDDLIEQYESGAVIHIGPYIWPTGEERWIVEIDGKDDPHLDVRIEADTGRPEMTAMYLVRGDEELEVISYPSERFRDGFLITDTLGGLRRRLRG
jgi:hypothetical protein